jgi:RNA polymerase sigma-70 factor, ECF subfamily
MNALSGEPVPGWAEFGDHYRGEAPRLAVFAMALGADRERAVQLAQESLVALWQRWDELAARPRTFVRTVTVRAGAEPQNGEVSSTGPLRIPTTDGHDAVLVGLARLPPGQRQVLVATFDDLSPDDVAQVLDIGAESVRPTADAARSALEGLLDGQEAQPAYEALVADVAAGMDVEAGLALVAAAVDGPADGTLRATQGGPTASSASRRRESAAEVPDELVTAAMAGDRAAVERLLEVIRPLVVRYCRGRLGPTDRSFLSADDVAQEVCLAVLTALPTYRLQGRPFLAFVYGIAAHKVIDAHRAVARGRADPVADVPDAVEVGAGPEQRALHGELSAQLRALLDELPDKQREILVLRIVVGLSAEETAEIVGTSAGAVRVAQHRALGRLRKIVPGGLGRGES